MRDNDDADALWAAIADPTRRRLLDVLLVMGDATATAIARELPVTRQAVAKHLVLLEHVGLVDRHRHGREVRYAIRPARLDAATRSLASAAARWDRRLAAIKHLAESAAGASSTNPETEHRGD